jgi:hypothetical protein
MPKCALNKDTDSPDDWKGTDDDVWYMRWRIPLKYLFAFANRCPKGITISIVFLPGLYLLPFTIWFTGWSWWYLFPLMVIPVARKWRLMPKTIFAIRGDGRWRFESTDSKSIIPADDNTNRTILFFPDLKINGTDYYLSRVQRWTRWHFQLQWPLLYAAHFYFKEANVPTSTQEHDTDGQLLNAYRGWHRDEDEIFWGDGGFAGTGWK